MTGSYLGEKRRILMERRDSKKEILKEGGQQALSHSWNDITRIDFALRRIEQGQYGLCCNCGIPIDEGRLTSIPETPFCTDCAQSRAN
jgi:RNA polymerase-binding transcription factor DksA